MTPVRLETAAPQSRVKYSTTVLPNEELEMNIGIAHGFSCINILFGPEEAV